MFVIDSEVSSRNAEGKLGYMLVSGISNRFSNKNLDALKRALQLDLRKSYRDKSKIAEHPVIAEYIAYYKAFKKTYHVALQIESVALKNKEIPSISPLVSAMFMAELKNGFLTAGHDMLSVQEPIGICTAKGGEEYELLNNSKKSLLKNDFFIQDKVGILSSIIHGPDSRTRITENTKKALFYTYVPFPCKEDLILEHLTDIATYIRSNQPDVMVEEKSLLDLCRE